MLVGFSRARIYTVLSFAALSAIAQPSVARPIPPDEEAQGFVRLFPGGGFPSQDWLCWEDSLQAHPPACQNGPAWKVFPSDAAFGKDTPVASIMSVRKWKDFEARFEFRSSNHSIFFYRIGVTENDHPAGNLGYALRGGQANTWGSGSDWDAYQSRPDTIKYPPTAGWSAARVVVNGDSVEHWLNGEKVVAYRIGSQDFRAHVSGSTRVLRPNFNKDLAVDSLHPLMKAGPIGWLGSWQGSVHVRNFRIADLPLGIGTGLRATRPSAAGRAGSRWREWADPSGNRRDAAGRRFPVPAPDPQKP